MIERENMHTAIENFLLDEGEILVTWTLVAEVADVDGSRYLRNRAGGGSDGNEMPMVWTVLGMLEGAQAVARNQLLAATEDDE